MPFVLECVLVKIRNYLGTKNQNNNVHIAMWFYIHGYGCGLVVVSFYVVKFYVSFREVVFEMVVVLVLYLVLVVVGCCMVGL